MSIDPKLKAKQLEKINRYYDQLLDRPFSGKVLMRFDKNVLQMPVDRDEKDVIDKE